MKRGRAKRSPGPKQETPATYDDERPAQQTAAYGPTPPEQAVRRAMRPARPALMHNAEVSHPKTRRPHRPPRQDRSTERETAAKR